MYSAIDNRLIWSTFMSILLISLYSSAAMSESSPSPVLQSILASTPPQVDGDSNDSAWSKAPVITTHDTIAGIDIHLQSVYTSDSIYMLVKFPDASENRKHKLMHWNENKKRYMTGPEREDTFVFKWNMLPIRTDISLSADTPYKADIWYWKAMRTDHAGYADDKIQTYQFKKTKQSKMLSSKNGSYFYLTRRGDKGTAAYTPAFYLDKASDTMPKYDFGMPTGSRADIKAKGSWVNGEWTIEFQRALNTDHSDDLQFNTDNKYFFGVSRYEIAGREANKNIEQHNFGSGEINQIIELNFTK